MKRGTKIGWVLVAVSIVLSVWVIASQRANANQTIDDAFVVSDDGTQLIQYVGVGGVVTIPDGVVSIDASVFANNKSITRVVMPSTVTTIGSGAFQGCSNMSGVDLSTSLGAIPDNAFRECTSLSTVQIPSSVTAIGSKAFYGCAGMGAITIPASVNNLPVDVFDECYGLSSITVDGNSASYSSKDGCLYNAAGNTLLFVPRGKTALSVSAGTTTIGGHAMTDCRNLTTVSLPNGVKAIEANALAGSSIGTITIPATVDSIGNQGGWKPSTIYGYADTYAETYAKDNNIPFIVVGNEGSGDDSEDPDDSDDDPENPGKQDEDPSNPSNPDDNTPTNPNDPGNPGANNGGQGGSGSGGGHTKDATPTTADGIDPRYFLCFAIFAGGVGVILYSRFNKLKYVSENQKNRY